MLDAAIEKVTNSDDGPVVHADRGAHYRWPGMALTHQRCEADPVNVAQRMLARQCGLRRLLRTAETELFYPRNWQATTIDQFIELVDSYIRWYNEKRIKISLGSLSPMEYSRSSGLLQGWPAGADRPMLPA